MTPGLQRHNRESTERDLLQSFENQVDSPSTKRPAFDLYVALNHNLKHFVQQCNDCKIVDNGQVTTMRQLLLSFCPGMSVSESYMEGKEKMLLDISNIKMQQLKGKEGSLVLNIKKGNQQVNPVDVNIRSICYNSVGDEDSEDTLFLPTVRVVDSNRSIVDDVPLFFESRNSSKSLAYSLLVAKDSEGNIKFIVHCNDDGWLEELQSPLHDENGYHALSNASSLLDIALGCLVQHEIIVTLVEDVDVSLTVATPKRNDATNPLSQIMEAIAAMEGVEAIKFVSSGEHLKCLPIPFDTDTTVFDGVLGSPVNVGFKNALFFPDQSWDKASGELEFEACRFNENTFCEFGPYHGGEQRHPFQVSFKAVTDKCLPEPVEFLESIIEAVQRGKIDQVKITNWSSDKDSKPIIGKLAELSRVLKGRLDLEGIDFSYNSEKTMNVRKKIAELNNLEPLKSE